MITSSQNVYFLKFRNSNVKYFFNSDKEGLLEILKLPNSKHGVEYVKIFNGVNKFNYITKKDFRGHFSWDTEVTGQLNKNKF